MSQLSLMTPEEEKTAAQNIAQIRVDIWKAILSYPPCAEGVASYVFEHMEEAPKDEIQLYRMAAKVYRDRDLKVNRDAFEQTRDSVAEILGYADADLILSKGLHEEVKTIQAGDARRSKLDVRPPRTGSRPFKEYVNSISKFHRKLERAKHKFVTSNLRLVVSVARRFNHGQLPLQDLIQEGNIGLMKAVDRFDHRKGFRFSTYGTWWIRHAVTRAIADKGREVRVPVHMLDAYNRVVRTKRELENQGIEATPKILAEKTGVDVVKIKRMDEVMLRGTSLDKPISDREGDGATLVDLLEDPTTSADMVVEIDDLSDAVKGVLSGLKPIERDIIRKRFGLGNRDEMTLKEIGIEHSLSRERIRQLQAQALNKIRKALAAERIM